MHIMCTVYEHKNIRQTMGGIPCSSAPQPGQDSFKVSPSGSVNRRRAGRGKDATKLHRRNVLDLVRVEGERVCRTFQFSLGLSLQHNAGAHQIMSYTHLRLVAAAGRLLAATATMYCMHGERVGPTVIWGEAMA